MGVELLMSTYTQKKPQKFLLDLDYATSCQIFVCVVQTGNVSLSQVHMQVYMMCTDMYKLFKGTDERY